MALPKDIGAPGHADDLKVNADPIGGDGPGRPPESEDDHLQQQPEGELVYKADAPPSRMKFIGTVAGDAQRKPFTLKG